MEGTAHAKAEQVAVCGMMFGVDVKENGLAQMRRVCIVSPWSYD